MQGINERPGTDQMTSGPMRGCGKNCTRWRRQTNTHTDGHGNSMTESTQWRPLSENYRLYIILYEDRPMSLLELMLVYNGNNIKNRKQLGGKI